MNILVEFGFERVDFVYEPGQFSIRGGIIDIFSYGNEYPYRVELFEFGQTHKKINLIFDDIVFRKKKMIKYNIQRNVFSIFST